MRLPIRGSLLVLSLLCLTSLVHANTIVVSNDEWMFRNDVINTNNDIQFAKNLSNFLTGGAPGNILILSSNVALTGSILNSTLTGQGYSLTYSSNQPASFSSYDAVFLAGPVGNNANLATNLTNYVNGGGNVFVEAGTGAFGGAAAEANFWNPFLNNFGLGYTTTTFNGVCCNINVTPFQSQGPYGPALFAGVNSIYMNNGNDVNVVGGGPGVELFSLNNHGLIGVYAPVPEPGSLVLLVGGLLGLTARLRRKI